MRRHIIIARTSERSFWDYEKFYDSLSLPKFMGDCRDIGYLVKLIVLGLIMHSAPRTIRAYDHHLPLGRPIRRINQKAAKLVNTGAMPQATYGKEACGVLKPLCFA